ncbi:hypothetical protein [Rhizobium sp. BK176]|uniref:hypothetical protein n=1 Tax=Rhizobium sp. BK176 TaxID=2587071 RepID=UPI002167B510|nr:hypothetical protein [Rhizobium sp. BK176]MCS4088646.1 hypothetical protein [Rhizobium sp. BK176]
MRTLISAVAFSLIALAGSASIASAQTCYGTQLVPTTMDCSANASRSADFSSPCTTVPAHVITVVVACPVPVVASNNGSSGAGGSNGGSRGDNCACDHGSESGHF